MPTIHSHSISSRQAQVRAATPPRNHGLEHFQKFCGRKKVAAVFNRHAKYMQKGLAVKNRRHDFITVAMTFNKML